MPAVFMWCEVDPPSVRSVGWLCGVVLIMCAGVPVLRLDMDVLLTCRLDGECPCVTLPVAKW